MCGFSTILFYFGRVLCLVWLALPSSILKGSTPTYFDIVFSSSPNGIFSVRCAPRSIWFAFACFRLVRFGCCCCMFALSIQLLRITPVVCSPYRLEQSRGRRRSQKKQPKMKNNIFIHLICLHMIFGGRGMRDFITQTEEAPQNSIYRFPNKNFIYLHTYS